MNWTDVSRWFSSRAALGVRDFLPCEGCPVELAELIYECVEIDRTKRLSAADLTRRLQRLLERAQSGELQSAAPKAAPQSTVVCAYLDAAPPTDE